MAFFIPLALIPVGAAIIGWFQTRPPNPPPAPTPEMTQQLMIREAQKQLGMDIENHYNFAVCGNSGTGKSTFINCIRLLDDVELNDAFVYAKNGPAPSGINESTMMPTKYCYPGNKFPYLTLWDLPGGGTLKHPAETYFEGKVLFAFDCLLLLKCGRFTQLDINIYKLAIMKYKIPIVIVMTKADHDVKSRARMKATELRRKLTSDEYNILIDETIQMLKNNAKDELIRAGCPEPSPGAMFVIAAQGHRDEKLGILEAADCPGLETEKLFCACGAIALYRRSQ